MPETPPAAAPQQPQGAPFGQSAATGPTPNKGYEAAAAQRLGSVVKILEELVPMAGAASEMGQAVLKALNSLAKYVPNGSVTPASQKNNIEQMSMKNTQNNAQMQALKAQAAGGQGGAPGAGGPPPMPQPAQAA